LTREPESDKSKALLTEFPNVKLLNGSYTSEVGLRAAFVDQDVAYFNIDSFQTGEPQEYFWTFRAYEIAIQSGLKWFIFAGASEDRFVERGYIEKYRNSHNIVGSRLSRWLAAQPVDLLPWTIMTAGGVYAEMFRSLLKPFPHGDGVVFKVPMDRESIMPIIPVENYGKAVKWALKHPQECIGKFVSAAPFPLTFDQIAEATQQVSGKKTEFIPITVDEWMTNISSHINPEARLPWGASEDDPTTFTFRKSFGAWWSIWKDNREFPKRKDTVYLASFDIDSLKTLQDWMVSTNYDPLGPTSYYV
jgi:hypothetical protein